MGRWWRPQFAFWVCERRFERVPMLKYTSSIQCFYIPIRASFKDYRFAVCCAVAS